MVGVNVQVFVVGDVYFFIFGFEDGYQGGEFFFGSIREVLVNEWIVGVLFEYISGDQVVGVDKVGFEVCVFGDFFVIEGWWCEDVEVFQVVVLQQFGDGLFQCYVKVWVGVEGGEVGVVSWVKQYDVDNWIFVVE